MVFFLSGNGEDPQMEVGWLLPVLISALALGFYDICKKHALKDNSVMPVLFFSTLAGTAGFAAYLALKGNFCAALAATPAEAGLITVKVLLVGGSWVCSYYAIRELPITLASPVRSTAPLWTFLGGVLIFGERLTPLQILAAAVIFGGYCVFSICGKLEGFPLRSRGMVLIIAGTLLGAASALYDKYLMNVRKLPGDRVQIGFMAGLTVLLGAAWLIRSVGFGKRHPFEWRWTIPAIGLVLVLADALYFYAVSLPEAQISLVSMLRRMSCVVSFGIGALIFGERNLRRKLAALALFLIGVILLSLRR
jgi:transporter family protein